MIVKDESRHLERCLRSVHGLGVAWTGRVHEQIALACLKRGDRPVLTGVEVRHSGYGSADVVRRKQARNLRLLELEHADRPDDPWVVLQLARVLPAERLDE